MDFLVRGCICCFPLAVFQTCTKEREGCLQGKGKWKEEDMRMTHLPTLGLAGIMPFESDITAQTLPVVEVAVAKVLVKAMDDGGDLVLAGHFGEGGAVVCLGVIGFALGEV